MLRLLERLRLSCGRPTRDETPGVVYVGACTRVRMHAGQCVDGLS